MAHHIVIVVLPSPGMCAALVASLLVGSANTVQCQVRVRVKVRVRLG